MISISLSVLTSFFLLSILFDSIHIFTFVFGTSLIGISLDYSIHFITEWYNEKDKKEVLKKILPSMSLSFITTIASYFALFLTVFIYVNPLKVLLHIGFEIDRLF